MNDDVLLTDLYQLTMLQAYYAELMNDIAVFEFFVRKMPAERNFLVAAGLEQVIEYLETLHFPGDDLDYLRQHGGFDEGFLTYLSTFRFTGDVDAMPEGTPFFRDEPILRVTAPIMQAQLIESRIINILHFQTLIASKAIRCVLQAPGKLLVDFGFRRAHGAEAGLFAARASYIAGFSGTATVLAGKRYGIPVFGTMAHSYIQAHASENDAFIQFAKAQPNNVVLLVDTYDTEAAASQLASVQKTLDPFGIKIKAVRLDSGDLAMHAKKVRAILDRQGLQHVTIFSSGNLDEYELDRLLNEQNAPIDGFGIGTKLDTSADTPYLDCAYKLQEYASVARRKRSEGKATWPGRKQVHRFYDSNGTMLFDRITLASEKLDGQSLIQPAMRQGKRVAEFDNLETIRSHLRESLATLPQGLKRLRPSDYRVEVSASLVDLAATVDNYPH